MSPATQPRNPTTTAKIPVRPLPVLVSVITDGLKQVRRNIAEIGKAMAEARDSKDANGRKMSYKAFLVWSEENFRLKETQTLYYLDIGRKLTGGEATVSSVREHLRNRKKTAKKAKQTSRGNGHAPSTAEHQLGVTLIEAGFRALAKTMHPDKGGSQSAMVMLNKVRGRLKTLWNQRSAMI